MPSRTPVASQPALSSTTSHSMLPVRTCAFALARSVPEATTTWTPVSCVNGLWKASVIAAAQPPP